MHEEDPVSGSEEDRPVSDWRTESRFYRRKPGAAWLLAFLAIPALLALIGWGGLDRVNRSGELAMPRVEPSATLSVPANPPSATGTAAPMGGFPPWSITRNGNGLTLAGELPDEETKSRWIDVIKQVMPGSVIDDKLTITPGVATPDAAALGGLFFAIASVPDFDLKLDADTVTLTGTAPAEDVKASAEEYAKASWPNVKVINNIQVVASSPTGTATAPPPAPAPTPGPGGGGP
jgi:peptidoglycan-binding protein ArfA